jgi:hypothetical protein
MIKLQQGDYVMHSDIADEAMHNELREAFRAAGCNIEKINGFIYGQDGAKVDMTVRDTPEARRLMEWLRIHDRKGAS